MFCGSISSGFFRALIKNNYLYGYYYVLGNVVTIVSKQNEDMYPPVLPESLTENLKYFKKRIFICNGKYISDSSTYSSCGIRRCKLDCVN